MCTQIGEVAVGADRDIAHRTGRDEIRRAIEVSTTNNSAWSHAITYINNGDGTFKRYDNDDQARLDGTYTTITWEEIIHTWSKNTSLFVIVPIDSELANARNVTIANERETIRRRREELRNKGIGRQQILQIIREEEKRTREEQTPRHTEHIETPNKTHPQSDHRDDLSNPTADNNTWPIQSIKETCINLTQTSPVLEPNTTTHIHQLIPLPTQNV